MRRRARPEASTLFVLDEAAQLGTFNELRQAVTLLRGYGLQTWSFWQDASQLSIPNPTICRRWLTKTRWIKASSHDWKELLKGKRVSVSLDPCCRRTT